LSGLKEKETKSRTFIRSKRSLEKRERLREGTGGTGEEKGGACGRWGKSFYNTERTSNFFRGQFELGVSAKRKRKEPEELDPWGGKGFGRSRLKDDLKRGMLSAYW